MIKEWNSANECAKAYNMSKPGFIKMAARKGIKTRKRAGKGGGLEYHVDGHPPDIQIALAKAQSKEKLSETDLPPKSASTSFDPARNQPEKIQEDETITAARAEGDAKAAQLEGKARARMEAKLEILKQFERFCQQNPIEQRRKDGGTLQKESFCALWNRGAIDSPARSSFPAITSSSIFRWTRQMHRAGMVRLSGQYGHRKGKGLIESQPQLAVALRAILCEKPHIQPKHAAEFLAVRYAESGYRLPCPRTVKRWVDSWKRENHELFARLENPDRWKSRYESAAGDAASSIVRPNQEWQADSTPADILLADGRHSLLFLIDVFTRRIKIHVSKTSTAAAVASLLRRGLLDWGVPETLKTDNGQDYVSQRLQSILLSLSIQHVRCIPFQARGKGFVERVIRTFAHDLLELLPGYAGHSVAERQALREREQFADRLYVKNSKIDMVLLSVTELQGFCDRWARAYENAPHTGIGGRPLERIANWREPTRRITDERALDLLLAPAPGKNGWRTLQKAGGITIDGYEYLSDVFGLHIKDRVKVLYDPEGGMEKVYVFNARGKFLCVAECPELTGIDRAEHAAKQKALQKRNIQALAAQAKAEAKTVDTRNAALDILRHRERQTPLAALPGPAEPHRTAALSSARDALEAADGQPKPVDETFRAQAQAALAAQRAKPATVVSLRGETPDQRYRYWTRLDSLVREAGGDASAAGEKDRRWYTTYPESNEFRTQKLLAENPSPQKARA